MGLDNSYVLLRFSEGIYGDEGATLPVDIDDFDYRWKWDGGTIRSAHVNTLTRKDGTPLQGGEKVIRFNLSILGPVSGHEALEIRPAGENTIYDAQGKHGTIEDSSGELVFYGGRLK